MPVKKGSRLWDPSRRVPSTHRASPVRTYVYEQLGISKPGFWADWRKRTIEEPEPDEYTPDEENEINDPSQEYHLAKWPEQEKAAKKDFTPMAMDMGTPQAAPQKGKAPQLAWAPLLRNQGQQWFKSNPLMTADSMSVSGLEKAIVNQQAADYLDGKGQEGLGFPGLMSLAKFYGKKQQERANARENRPFGAGEPTNFDKMMDLVYKPKPIYQPPTFKILTQGTTTMLEQVPNYTVGQLNVSQNGYVTNPATPQEQAKSGLQAAKVTKKPKATLQGAGSTWGAGGKTPFSAAGRIKV